MTTLRGRFSKCLTTAKHYLCVAMLIIQTPYRGVTMTVVLFIVFFGIIKNDSKRMTNGLFLSMIEEELCHCQALSEVMC